MRRTLDRGKHVVLADVPVRSLTAGHEVRLDPQWGRASIYPVSHLRGRQDVVDAAARRQLASCHEHADQSGARLHGSEVNGTAHRLTATRVWCSVWSPRKALKVELERTADKRKIAGQTG